jgi:hypothetical protein
MMLPGRFVDRLHKDFHKGQGLADEHEYASGRLQVLNITDSNSLK